MCIYSNVRKELSNFIMDTATTNKILETNDYYLIDKSLNLLNELKELNDELYLWFEFKTKKELLYICLDNRYFSLLEFYSINEIYDFLRCNYIDDIEEVLEVLDGFNNILSEIIGSHYYDYITFFINYSWVLNCNDYFEVIEPYYYLDEFRIPNHIKNMFLDILDNKEYIIWDGVNFNDYTAFDANDICKYEFDCLNLEDIYKIYEEY